MYELVNPDLRGADTYVSAERKKPPAVHTLDA